MSRDSTEKTKEHITRVGELLDICLEDLAYRAEQHDEDKISDETEKALFDEYTEKLASCTYGSDEYKGFLEKLKPALDIHYKNNRHHPEHFENGIQDMNLLDILEMICDWKASSERHDNGNIRKSIELNQKRFRYSDELKTILNNTIDYLEKLDWENIF